jgi:hypothetical protein
MHPAFNINNISGGIIMNQTNNFNVLKDLYSLKKLELNGDQLYVVNKFISYLELNK